MPHDVCFSGSHVALYLHRGGQLRAALPGLHAKLLRAMRAQPGDWGDPSSPLRVRCVELHQYSRGGGLLEAAHRDNGSVLTLSVLLSAPGREHAGGEFVTYAEGAPVLHAAQGRGDALLFHSERLHNVCTVTRGVRRALVVELWAQAENGSDRFK